RNRIQGMSAQGNDQVPISIEQYNRQNNVVGNVLGVSGVQGSYAWYAPAGCSGSTAIYRFGYYQNVSCDSSQYDTAATMATIIHGNYDAVTKGIAWDPTISDHNLPN